jgi:LPS-assembly lipoprotein
MRGTKDVPPEMERTYIETIDRRSIFYRKIRSELQAHGVEVVDSVADATAVFSIMADVTGQRVVSVSAQNVPREYEVYYTVQYELNTLDATLLPDHTQTTRRDYTWNETKVLGKAKEEALLRDAIADDLVRIVLVQITSL